MDNSWLLELAGSKFLIDPWLEGKEVDLAPWFNSQWHRTAPLSYAKLPAYDAVLITQQYPDHCHLQTLQRLQPKLVVAPRAVAKRLERTLPRAEIRLFDQHTRHVQIGGVGIRQLPSKRHLPPFYHAYLLDDGERSVMLANHGYDLHPHEIAELTKLPVHLLLSPFNHYRLPLIFGGDVSPGIHKLADLVQQLNPQHVLQTHDELKHASGLISRLARVDAFDHADAPLHPYLNGRFKAVTDYAVMRL